MNKYIFNSKNHVRTHDMPSEWLSKEYLYYVVNKVNVNYFGGKSLHRQYYDAISYLDKLSGARSSYGSRLFIYQLIHCKNTNAKGFKVILDTHEYSSKNHTTYKSWYNTLEMLEAEGFGKLYIGDSRNVGVGIYHSVFELYDKSFDLISKKNDRYAPKTMILPKKTDTVLTTIKHDKKHEKIVTTNGIRKEQNVVNDLNIFLSQFEFRMGNGQILDPSMTRKFSLYEDCRKNNGLSMFDSYGRFTCDMQQLPQVDRAACTIDGECVCECDYSSNHAFIAYEREGIICEDTFKPYVTSCAALRGSYEQQRAINKKGMMMCFNAKNAPTALYNLINSMKSSDNIKYKNIDKSLLPNRRECTEIIHNLKKFNGRIKNYFGGFANLLQNIDSRIAENVMKLLKNKGIPFQCIHDSFVVPLSKKLDCITAMKDAWGCVLGSNYNCRVDVK